MTSFFILTSLDMLFLLPGSASPIRLHNAFIQLDEIDQEDTFENFIRMPDVREIIEAYGVRMVEEYYNEVKEDEPDISNYEIEDRLYETVMTWRGRGVRHINF